ncbi:hypothetical protein [Oricola sp.]|uniref:hypothetical protein n=1 Tax=Oricola sp. TaxID=1979950 RepID=UPI0025FF8DBE|nr:hypothetical protein [Oricola sp.]MCI5078694.1 hypothetical protein [Oricola sp.]
MAIALTIKRGSRAQIEAAASNGALVAGEPYLVTDEGRIAVGLSGSSYEVFAKLAEAGGETGDLDYGLISGLPTSATDYGSIA